MKTVCLRDLLLARVWGARFGIVGLARTWGVSMKEGCLTYRVGYFGGVGGGMGSRELVTTVSAVGHLG